MAENKPNWAWISLEITAAGCFDAFRRLVDGFRAQINWFLGTAKLFFSFLLRIYIFHTESFCCVFFGLVCVLQASIFSSRFFSVIFVLFSQSSNLLSKCNVLTAKVWRLSAMMPWLSPWFLLKENWCSSIAAARIFTRRLLRWSPATLWALQNSTPSELR